MGFWHGSVSASGTIHTDPKGKKVREATIYIVREWDQIKSHIVVGSGISESSVSTRLERVISDVLAPVFGFARLEIVAPDALVLYGEPMVASATLRAAAIAKGIDPEPSWRIKLVVERDGGCCPSRYRLDLA